MSAYPFIDSIEISNLEEKADPNQVHKSRILGFTFSNLASIFDSCYLILIKAMQSAGARFIDITLLRFVMSALVALVVIIFTKQDIKSSFSTKSNMINMAIRTALGLGYLPLMVYAITLIPLSIMSILIATRGAFGTVLCYLLLHEVPLRKEIIAMIVGFIGVIFIVTGKDSPGTEVDYEYIRGILLAFIATSMLAGCDVQNRRLKHLHFSVIQFDYTVISSIVVLIPWLCITVPALQHNVPVFDYPWQLLIIASVNLLSALAMLFGTGAVQHEHPGIVSMIQHIAVLYAFVADIFLFKYSFSWIQIVGGVLVLSMNAYIGVNKIRNKF